MCKPALDLIRLRRQVFGTVSNITKLGKLGKGKHKREWSAANLLENIQETHPRAVNLMLLSILVNCDANLLYNKLATYRGKQNASYPH